MKSYLAHLQKHSEFTGEIYNDAASLFVHATDNSIYQKIPQVVIKPKNAQDVQILVKATKQFPEVFFAARGGGTGTNGQSLTEGIVIDTKKYLNNILNINLKEAYIEVEAGTVLNKLNEALKPKGYFFPVDISPYDRATIGGMISTDACGKGSYHHGRMGDNILELKYIDSEGDIQTITKDNASEKLTKITPLLEEHKTEIIKSFPEHIRYSTGYNLKKLLETKNFNYLFAGSEGTLGIIISAKLKICKIIPYQAVVVNFYNNFNDSIADVTNILIKEPFAIEVMDELLLELAKADETTQNIQKEIYINESIKAISLVEFNAETETQLSSKLTEFTQNNSESLTKYQKIIRDPKQISELYLLRKNAVGIVANLDVKKRPTPFIEDAAVPVKFLTNYIKELKELLDSYKLRYVIYGHADVGLVHVRPALDLELKKDKALLSKLTLLVIELVKKYDGVIWGEHSSGFRSVVADKYYGTEIIKIFKSIKQILDPNNIFNPGKIVAENPRQKINLTEDLQSDFNIQIEHDLKTEFQSSLLCNGNGKCLSNKDNQLMCPTFKVTQDLTQSPKGRSNLIRLWLNFISQNQVPEAANAKTQYAKENRSLFQKIFQSLDSCLTCHACSSSCPVKVSVPKHRARFMSFYYGLYPKNLQVRFLENLESFLILLYRFKTPSFYLIRINILSNLLAKILGLSDINNAVKFSKLKTVDTLAKNKCYIFSDIVTTIYTPEILASASNILTKLNIEHGILTPVATGMSYHHFGNETKLTKHLEFLISKFKNHEIIIIDPAIYDFFKTHLPKELNLKSYTEVIANYADNLTTNTPKNSISFYGHCVGNSMHQDQAKIWAQIFTRLGFEFNNISQNCCGMAGFYGYQQQHYQTSKKLYQTNVKQNDEIVFDGISCIMQNKRLGKNDAEHIITKLDKII